MLKYTGRPRLHEAAWAERMKQVIHFLQSFPTRAKAALKRGLLEMGMNQATERTARFKEPKSTYWARSLGCETLHGQREPTFHNLVIWWPAWTPPGTKSPASSLQSARPGMTLRSGLLTSPSHWNQVWASFLMNISLSSLQLSSSSSSHTT